MGCAENPSQTTCKAGKSLLSQIFMSGQPIMRFSMMPIICCGVCMRYSNPRTVFFFTCNSGSQPEALSETHPSNPIKDMLHTVSKT
ncbi:hypothetical protein VNO77_16240 [Canavalia gladiata]|uniref:Uncharacterized protein n=1 Tax=Canavalia gladiata TaxID=3824 RepID=A0AAN9QRX4_CANGL